MYLTLWWSGELSRIWPVLDTKQVISLVMEDRSSPSSELVQTISTLVPLTHSSPERTNSSFIYSPVYGEEWNLWGQNPICNMGEKSILSGDSRSSILLHRHRHGPYCCPHLIITNGLMFSCVTSMITALTSAEPTALTEGEIWAVKLRTEDDGRTDGWRGWRG